MTDPRAFAQAGDKTAAGDRRNNNFPKEGPPQIRSAPRRCRWFGDGIDFLAGAVQARKLKWKHWGSKRTNANGEYFEPMNVEDPWLPLRVKLSKPVERCGRTVYSKATFSGSSFRLWTCWTLRHDRSPSACHRRSTPGPRPLVVPSGSEPVHPPSLHRAPNHARLSYNPMGTTPPRRVLST